MQASGSHYLAGGKYCRSCECYIITQDTSCECCGMQLRASPSRRTYKEKVRANKKTAGPTTQIYPCSMLQHPVIPAKEDKHRSSGSITMGAKYRGSLFKFQRIGFVKHDTYSTRM